MRTPRRTKRASKTRPHRYARGPWTSIATTSRQKSGHADILRFSPIGCRKALSARAILKDTSGWNATLTGLLLCQMGRIAAPCPRSTRRRVHHQRCDSEFLLALSSLFRLHSAMIEGRAAGTRSSPRLRIGESMELKRRDVRTGAAVGCNQMQGWPARREICARRPRFNVCSQEL